MPELAPLPDPAIRRGQRLEAIKMRERHIAWLTAQQRLDIAALSRDDRGGMYARYVADELAVIWRRSPRQARNRLDNALVFADFPAVHALIGDGTWLIDHADAALDALAGSGLDRDQQQQVLDLVLSRRVHLTPWEVKQAVRTASVVLFPEHATAEAEKAEKDRDVRSYLDRPGASLIASGPTHLVAAMMASLDALTWPPAPDDPRTVAQRRFDTLLDLVCGRIQPDNWQVHVLTDLATLEHGDQGPGDDSGSDDSGSDGDAGGDSGGGDSGDSGGAGDHAKGTAADAGVAGLPGEIVGYGPIPPAQARELARMGVLRRVVVDEQGRLVAVESRVHRPDLPDRPEQSERRPAHPSDVEPDPEPPAELSEDVPSTEDARWLALQLNGRLDEERDPRPDCGLPDPAPPSIAPPESRSDGSQDDDRALDTPPQDNVFSGPPSQDDLSWYEASFDRAEELHTLQRSLAGAHPAPVARAPDSLAATPAAADSHDTEDEHLLRDKPPDCVGSPADTGENSCPPYLPNRWSAEGLRHALHRLRTDPIRPLDLSSEKYVVPRPLRRFLELRDRTCVFPGCPRPAIKCDKDHLVPWPRGATSELNLANECDPHHHGKHEYFTVVRLTDGTFRWTSPAGITADRPPRPVLEAWTYRARPS